MELSTLCKQTSLLDKYPYYEVLSEICVITGCFQLASNFHLTFTYSEISWFDSESLRVKLKHISDNMKAFVYLSRL